MDNTSMTNNARRQSGVGALPVPDSKSALYTLWVEWLNQGGSFQSQLYMTLSASQREFPMKDSELALEAKKASFRLMSTANERSKRYHSPEGALVGNADAQVLVHIAFNRMAAWLFAFPPINEGKHMTEEMVREALKKQVVTYGVDESALKQMVENRLYFQFVPIAYGEKAVNGVAGYIEEYFPHAAPKPEPKRDENGEIIPEDDDDVITAPVRHGYVQNIPKGEIIAHVFPPKPGIPGMDVVGNKLPCRNGATATLAVGQNTTLEEGGDLVSDIEGSLFYERNKFYVQPLYIVTEHLVPSAGPLTFDGDVEILGDVKENTVINATGSVTIKGLVEASTISSDKNIFIDGGVLGDNRGILRAKGKVHAKYLEYCVVYAGDDVRVGDVISSQLYSNGKIEIRGGHGTIIGGCVVAPYEIIAHVIGSRAECKTEIRLGEFPCTALRQDEYDARIDSMIQECEQLDATIAELEQDPTAPQNGLLVRTRLRRSSIGARIESLRTEKESLRSRCEEFSQCKLRVDTVYPNTYITIDEADFVVREQSSFFTAVLSPEGEIKATWRGGR